MDKTIPQTVEVYRLDGKDAQMKMVLGRKRFAVVVDGGGPGPVQGRARALQELCSQSLGNTASS